MDITSNITAITEICVRITDAISEAITVCTEAGKRMEKTADITAILIEGMTMIMIADIENEVVTDFKRAVLLIAKTHNRNEKIFFTYCIYVDFGNDL